QDTFCCLNVQIQYGANDAFLTRGVHPIILVSSAPTSMLATVTDAHMPGDLVQSVGEVLWLSSLFFTLFILWVS
ncbi:hypothetical protein, partial [Shewanella algae]|uniref:hypothetical protein n=1 Tax=Shewanella algae TaxID=38313 RepID=UPI001C90EA9C